MDRRKAETAAVAEHLGPDLAGIVAGILDMMDRAESRTKVVDMMRRINDSPHVLEMTLLSARGISYRDIPHHEKERLLRSSWIAPDASIGPSGGLLLWRVKVAKHYDSLMKWEPQAREAERRGGDISYGGAGRVVCLPGMRGR